MEYPPEGMKDQSPRDVILINKVHYHTDSTAVVHVTQLSMFTCTIALLIIGVKRVIHWSLCSSNTWSKQWGWTSTWEREMEGVCKKKTGLILKDSEVLYQVCIFNLLWWIASKAHANLIHTWSMDLRQDSKYIKGKYRVLEVDKDRVRMSKFIETKLKCQFEDWKAFYEAESEEDLLYCKKILRPIKEEVCFWTACAGQFIMYNNKILL